GEHAFDAQRLAGVDALDASLGDRRGDDAAVGEAGRIEFGGIFGRAGDLGASVDAGGRSADVGLHGVAHTIFLFDCDCGVPREACVSVRTMPRRASSILKELCSSAFASRSTMSAA